MTGNEGSQSALCNVQFSSSAGSREGLEFRLQCVTRRGRWWAVKTVAEAMALTVDDADW